NTPTSTHNHTITSANTLNANGNLANWGDSDSTDEGTSGEPEWIKLATVQNNNVEEIPVGIISLWQGLLENIPEGWIICDGENETLNTINKWIKGANTVGEIGTTGGSGTSHTHTGVDHIHPFSNHNHSISGSTGLSSANTGRTGIGQTVSNSTHTHN